MRFYPLPHRTWPVPTHRHDVAYLIPDTWDDWFKYETRNSLYYVDPNGDVVDIGSVKIAQFGMGRQRSVEFEKKSFRAMEGLFSLGQDVSYYETLNDLPTDTRTAILVGLGDIVYDEDLYERALDENVTGTSLMRYVSASTVEQQFRRALLGGERLERFAFSFKYPDVPRARAQSPSLRFEVTPGSVPPSNVHAIIGRNGVGKTFLLENLAKCLVPELAEGNEPLGEVRVHTGSLKFAGVTSVTFSAFDAFEPLSQPKNRTSGPEFTYIGLKAVRKSDARTAQIKAPTALAREFGASMRACLLDERIDLWRAALSTLASDPIFNNAGIDDLAREDDLDLVPDAARDLFKRLSSGHKIVLLTVTRLVEVVEERSLILLDEPEAHLHPPLLSAFIRALSDLLQERNGVAIVTTHSPVVLQEVPSRCAWIVNRQGRIVDARRPETETFGENVGVLTHEIFGLEVTQSGFYRLLQQEVEGIDSYSDLLDRFGGQLGSEASAMARAMFLSKRRQSDRGA